MYDTGQSPELPCDVGGSGTSMRLFFHIRAPEGLTLDPDGEEQPDLDAARLEAHACIRELMEDIWLNKTADGRQFELTDADGNVLLVVPFDEAWH
jgi:hypothetical protein